MDLHVFLPPACLSIPSLWVFPHASVSFNFMAKKKKICFTDYKKAFDYVNHNKLWKILKVMGIPDHLTCLLRNLHAGQEVTVRTGYVTADFFQTGTGVCQHYVLSPCLFNLYAEYIM